ncbi:MAG TPA: hypothetical protein VHO46_03355 [Bacteroidales bacterium]|nr:hypothetical protein [Bacteroidales bacterium]
MLRRIYLPGIFLFLSFINLNGQQTSGTIKRFGLFDSDEPLEITLRCDVTAYLRKKAAKDYMKAELVFNPDRPDSLAKQVRFRLRGVFRQRYCAMAPIELNFKKVKFGYSDLDSIDKLKMATQCGFGTDDERLVMREFLVYKMFSVFTDTSFRVRLLRINYIDINGHRKPMTQWGFFIEPASMLEYRTSTIQITSDNLTQKHIFPFIMDRLAIFNYMAGNYDWSVPGQHNIKVFKPLNQPWNEYGIAVPFDFDWSGIVNAPYAQPVESIGLKSVRERLFLGICRDIESYRRQFQLFESKKDKLYSIINEFSYLNSREKEDITGFLDSFFIQLKGNQNKILIDLKTNCKNF